LRDREKHVNLEKPTFTNQIRKKITLRAAAEIVEDMYSKTLGLKE